MYPNPQFSLDLVTFTGGNSEWKASFFAVEDLLTSAKLVTKLGTEVSFL